LLKHADTELHALAEVKIGFGQVIDADEHQRRPQRDRTEGACGHAVNATLRSSHSDHRHAAGKAAERGAELFWRDQLFHFVEKRSEVLLFRGQYTLPQMKAFSLRWLCFAEGN